MIRTLRSLLMTCRLNENTSMRSIVPLFIIVTMSIVCLTFLTSLIADGCWKPNWNFASIEIEGHFKSERWDSSKDFQFDEDAPIDNIINYFSWPNNSSCVLAQDFGGTLSIKTLYNELEGRTSVCFISKEIAPPLSGCVVYSFHDNDEWSFVKAMAAYGCQVFAFILERTALTTTIVSCSFFSFKLGSKSLDNWAGETKISTKTLGDIYQQLLIWHDEESIIDYLKLDIEWAEWSILPQIIESGMMDKVRQLAVQIHLPYRAPFFERGQSLAQFRRLANIVRAVENYGMVRFNSKPDSPFRAPSQP